MGDPWGVGGFRGGGGNPILSKSSKKKSVKKSEKAAKSGENRKNRGNFLV